MACFSMGGVGSTDINSSLANGTFGAGWAQAGNQSSVPYYQYGNQSETLTEEVSSLEVARGILKMIVVPVICVFGILGNILTLVILTRKRLKSSCDGTERTVNIGLIALAVSDLLCCIALLPHGLLPREPFDYTTKGFHIIYRTYDHALINTFFLTSTWLTVTMATSRYLAICHPFKARHFIGVTGTKASVFLVFIISLLFNIPRFLERSIETVDCQDGSAVYFVNTCYIMCHQMVQVVYVWMYFTLGIVLPLTLLAFCNICLVKALRESSRLRRRYRVPAAHVDSNYRITSILVTIVVMYILLVSPSEILRFLSQRRHHHDGFAWATAIEVTNVLQSINFACDFVLYFVLNVHFRQAMKDIMWGIVRCFFSCFGVKKEIPRKGRQMKSQMSLTRHSTSNTFV